VVALFLVFPLDPRKGSPYHPRRLDPKTPNPDSESTRIASPLFATTLWTVVRAAAGTDESKAAAALEQLCRRYWYPLYAFARRRGHDAEAAQDLTQGFFGHLLEKNLFSRANRGAGKFRSYLLTSFKNFIGQERLRAQAQKRGGGQELLSIDAEDAEGRYRLEPLEKEDPESLFDRRWAISLFERVLERLEQELRESGKGAQFERLQDFLTGDGAKVAYADLAGELGVSEGALRVTVHRLRNRYRELIREELAQTVSTAEELQDELSYLIKVLSS